MNGQFCFAGFFSSKNRFLHSDLDIVVDVLVFIFGRFLLGQRVVPPAEDLVARVAELLSLAQLTLLQTTRGAANRNTGSIFTYVCNIVSMLTPVSIPQQMEVLR